MIYRDFKGEKLSLLGFGAMRLPLKEDGSVDAAHVKDMIDYAMEQEVNYFDTAYPYHNGMSEKIVGEILSEYPRDAYYLATKYPGHQIADDYDPAAIFEEQLKKCRVEYFDYYLLHNIYENSINVYMDPQWGIIDYFIEQKKQGRIRHLGFSAHGGLDILERFLEYCGDEMEFCQIQLNYLDWTLQQAKEKYDMLTERGIPVWVMEPVRGGALAKISEDAVKKMKAMRPDETPVAWTFRFLQRLPNVAMVLSGMSNLEQMKENIETFRELRALTDEENQLVLDIAEGMKDSVPCTACRYCCDDCPAGLDIPMLLSVYNEIRVEPLINSAMRVEALPKDKWPNACIGCGKCAKLCPQGIDVPKYLKDFAERFEKIPRWETVSRERAASQIIEE